MFAASKILRRAGSARGLATLAAARGGHQTRFATAIAAGAGAAGAYALLPKQEALAEWSLSSFFGGSSAPPAWDAVKAEIAAILEDDPNTGPFFVRLAWHCAGSYDKASNTGGSNGATMRFKPESDHGGNAGLGEARDLLEPIKEKHPELTYADIYTFAGKAAIEIMGGPSIPWKPGRVDYAEGEGVTPDGRLPDGDQGPEHLRAIFHRMGFDDREIVALSGAHCLGFCHSDRSGFEGPWTPEPYKFTNLYFDLMLNKKWELNPTSKQPQFRNADDGTLMMLSTDLALITDLEFRKHVDRYAADEKVFSDEFAVAFGKLLALGVE